MAEHEIHSSPGCFATVYDDTYWMALTYAYLLYGTMKKAAEAANVPYQTALGWKRDKEAKWNYWMTKSSQKMQGKSLYRLNGLLALAMDVQRKNLEDGEERITKDGTVVNVRANVAATNAALGTILDKIHRMGGGDNAPAPEPSKKSKKDLEWELTQIGRKDLVETRLPAKRGSYGNANQPVSQ